MLGEYVYNGNGQRVIKKASVKTTIYHYDLAGNLIAESTAEGNAISDYIYMGNQRLARIDKVDDKVYYYHNDHLGTPQKMTDVSGVVVWAASYKPFGKAEVDEASAIANNFRLPGQYHDSETGLHYNRFRYYVPPIGRYNRTDPLGQFGNLNVYIYANNNPIMSYDELGLFTSPYGCAKKVAKKYEPMSVSDKYKHCMTAGEIYTQCGPLTAYAASIGKEIKDMFGPGDASWDDLMADMDGIECAKNPIQSECDKPATLEECCKSKKRTP